jgi:hypothetical protein
MRRSVAIDSSGWCRSRFIGDGASGFTAPLAFRR